MADKKSSTESAHEKKVLCLFNRVREGSLERIAKGEESDNSYFGMLRLAHFGYPAEYLEIEQFFSPAVCKFLRKHLLNIHFVHTPLFRKILSYDIVFTSTAFGTFFLWVLYPFKKPKWVMFDFNLLGIIGEKKTLKQKIFSFLVSRSSGIVTISREGAEEIKKAFPQLKEKTQFIPLGTDTKWFAPQSIQEKNLIFSPGRDPGRDYKTFFEAVRGIPAQVIITAKPQKLKKYSLPENVKPSDLTAKEMVDMYAKAKIVVLPLHISDEYYNAMGCSTLVEAMAMGKAIIATRSATMESYIQDGENGILVPQNDALAFRKAINELLSDPDKRKRLGEGARKFTVQYSEAEKFAKNLADFFEKI
ncbi:MAG: glycosyltransferase family 4 protein [Candidatus Parcubacteria bacterium]|nr:glycosyltransferase family 4 protein [Candidatus Parcubacteria bacterium]